MLHLLDMLDDCAERIRSHHIESQGILGSLDDVARDGGRTDRLGVGTCDIHVLRPRTLQDVEREVVVHR